MKIYIMTDLEGPSGVNGRPAAEVGNQIINLETARQALVNEVNACIEGLLEAGASEFVVVDGHGGSNSIDIFKLHPAADLVQRGDECIPSVCDASFSAAIQIGAHSMQQAGGYLCHSFSSHGICGVWLNGKPIGEIGIGASIAGCFNVPTILVSGDEAACWEARTLLGPQVATVPTKLALGRYSARNYSPTRVYAALRKQAREALLRKNAIPVLKPEPPFELIYRMMCPNQANAMELHGAERLDEQTVRYRGNDFASLWFGRGLPPGYYEQRFGKLTPDWTYKPAQNNGIPKTNP